MSKKNQFIVAICITIISIIFYALSFNVYNQFTLTSPSGQTKNINMPYDGIGEDGVYTFAGSVKIGIASSSILKIIPDDEVLEIKINDKTVPLDERLSGELYDYSNGFIYDFGPYLNPGKNRFIVRLKQSGRGVMGLKINQPANKVFFPLFIILFLWFVFLLLRVCRISLELTSLFLVGLGVRLLYFAVTPHNVRAHDLEDHFGYVAYMAENWLPPSVDSAMGGAFFHPPLYYYLGGVVHKITNVFISSDIIVIYGALQCFSLLCSAIFLFFGLKIIEYSLMSVLGLRGARNISFSRNLVLWIGVLFALWPSAIVHSVRIGNDPLLYALFAWSFYYILKWFSEEKMGDLFKASLIGGFCVLAKANGAILLATVGSLLLFKIISTKSFLRYVKMIKWPAVFFGISLAITFAPGMILKLQGKRETLYVDNIDNVSQALRVGNTPKNYLWFDLETFITKPFTSPWDDALGRQYFWNYLGKTGLFGEFSYSPALAKNMAEVISFFAVLLLLFNIAGLYRSRKNELTKLLPHTFLFFYLWAGVTYMRATFPVNIDFRYVVPILIPFCVFSGASILVFHCQKSIRLRNLNLLILALFSLASFVFFLALFMA